MRRIDYGIDAPGVIRNLFVIGGLLLAAVLFAPPRVGPFRVGGTGVTLGIRGMFAGGAISCLLGGALMILYAEVGKFRHRDRMLAMIPWTGAENVLDVGTGLVLRPGGVALISDFRETALYEAAFREADFSVERSGLGLFATYPPMRIVTARKPAA